MGNQSCEKKDTRWHFATRTPHAWPANYGTRCSRSRGHSKRARVELLVFAQYNRQGGSQGLESSAGSDSSPAERAVSQGRDYCSTTGWPVVALSKKIVRVFTM